MPQITQSDIITGGLIDAAALQRVINALYAVINQLDKDNLDRSSNKFLWGNVKLDELLDPDGTLTDSTDLQVAVTKNFIKTKIFDAGGALDPAVGDWHKHSNKAALDAIIQAFVDAMVAANGPSSSQPFVTKGGGDLGQNDLDAITGAASPSGTNVFATIADLPAGGGISQAHTGYGVTTGGAVAIAANTKILAIQFEGLTPLAVTTFPTGNLRGRLLVDITSVNQYNIAWAYTGSLTNQCNTQSGVFTPGVVMNFGPAGYVGAFTVAADKSTITLTGPGAANSFMVEMFQ